MQGKHELVALDGVRGVAILGVFFFHIATMGAFKTVPVLHGLSLIGWLGVDLFFAMSGYLITKTAFDKKGQSRFVRGFYVRRARRILPVYVVTLAVFLPIAFLFFSDAPTIPDLTSGLPCLALFCINMQAALTSRVVPFGFNHFWSLAVEAQLYAVWPLLVASLDKRRFMFLAAALAAISILLRLYTASTTGNWVWNYFSTLTRLDSFSLGALVYLLPQGSLRKGAAFPVLGCSAAATLLVAWFNSGIEFNQPWTNALGITCVAFFSAALVMIIVDRRSHLVAAVLSGRIISRLGELSYSFYALHFPILALGWYAFERSSYWHFGLSFAHDLTMAATYLSITVIMSMISFRFVEKPFMGRRHIDRPVPASIGEEVR